MLANEHVFAKVSGKLLLNSNKAGSGPEAQWSEKENIKKAANHKKHKPTSVVYPSEQVLIEIKNTEVFHLFEIYSLCAFLLVCSQFVLPYALKDHEYVKRVDLSCFETNE